jgi:1-deoxy-D-xylulose-5-phosphate synthase
VGILERIHGAADVKALDCAELDQLCAEIRQHLISVVSRNGGHLASNLGIVELTVALFNVYDPMRDRILYDVGHQCYVHKLLSGRLEEFDTLRQHGGISGFPKPEESDADAFVAGHASSSVSTALGMAHARTLTGADHDVVAVLGDGSLTGGLAYEGLNSLGQSKEPIVIILNDNGIAISDTVGGVARYLNRERLKPAYYRTKKLYRKVMLRLPGGKGFFRFTQGLKNRLKSAIFHCSMFEDMGLRYMGPVDGHNVKQLSYMLKLAREYREPVLLHVVTKKGKGYKPAEETPNLYHGVAPFDPAVGVVPGSRETFSSVFGDALCALAEKDDRICAVTAAMEEGTGLLRFHDRYPDRFFDEGISEGHCASMCGGMAKQGLKPVFAVYSTFLQRSYDMLIQDVAMQKLPVVLAVDRAGLVGSDGETHNGVFDVGFLRQVPGMAIWSPSSYAELRRMLAAALEADCPAAVRYPRGSEGEYRDCHMEAIAVLRQGKDVSLLGYGILINELLRAADLLAGQGIQAQVLKLSRIDTVDADVLDRFLPADAALIVAEDCVETGSVGEYIAANLKTHTVYPLNLGRNGFVRQGSVHQQWESCGIDAASIAKKAAEA